MIIGKAGATIQQLQQMSGSRIQMQVRRRTGLRTFSTTIQPQYSILKMGHSLPINLVGRVLRSSRVRAPWHVLLTHSIRLFALQKDSEMQAGMTERQVTVTGEQQVCLFTILCLIKVKARWFCSAHKQHAGCPASVSSTPRV
jgi:hypothetical protein